MANTFQLPSVKLPIKKERIKTTEIGTNLDIPIQTGIRKSSWIHPDWINGINPNLNENHKDFAKENYYISFDIDMMGEQKEVFENNVSISNIIRKPRVSISGNMTEICEVSLGTWRNFISDRKDIENILIGKRAYYDKNTGIRKDKDGANTSYKFIVMCNNDNIEMAKSLLKNILSKIDKIGEWLI